MHKPEKLSVYLAVTEAEDLLFITLTFISEDRMEIK